MMAVRRLFTQLGLSANFLIFLSLLATPAMAQVEGGRGLDASGLQKQVEAAHETAESAALAGHNAWMLTCCALVLFMTAPGLALFYGGLVRKKNVLGVMMQCFFLMGLMTVLWALYGYTLAFGGSFDDLMAEGSVSNPYIGNLDPLFMNGIERFWDEETNSPHTPMNGYSGADIYALSGHVLYHHPCPDLRGVCRADEIQHHGRLYHSLGHTRLLPAGALGLGWRNLGLWRALFCVRRSPRLCRWHGGSYQFRHLGAGLCYGPRSASRLGH
jgi:hypothetical protein